MATSSFILDISISRMGRTEAVSSCLKRVVEREGGYACFVNVHTVVEGRRSLATRRALEGATYRFADGLPLVWVSRLQGQSIRSRVCGPDFMMDFLGASSEIVHGFVGGSPGQAELIARKLGVTAICYSPPIRSFSTEGARADWLEFLQKFPSQPAPAVVWVGLGAPKQELWMNAVSPLAPQTFFFGVGAAFDFLSQTKKRAPLWMQRSGLEWFFRLSQEPARLWRRYLTTNSLFLIWVMVSFLKSPRTGEK